MAICKMLYSWLTSVVTHMLCKCSNPSLLTCVQKCCAYKSYKLYASLLVTYMVQSK